jgi:hypothetical protein
MTGLLSLLPLLIILACPLMMLLMMRGMSARHDEHGAGQEPPGQVGPPQERSAELEREVARLTSEHADDFDRWEQGI